LFLIRFGFHILFLLSVFVLRRGGSYSVD